MFDFNIECILLYFCNQWIYGHWMINYYNILNLILNFITDKGNKFIGTQGSYKELHPFFKDLSSTFQRPHSIFKDHLTGM